MDEESVTGTISWCFSSYLVPQNVGFYSHAVTKIVLSTTCVQRKLNSVCAASLSLEMGITPVHACVKERNSNLLSSAMKLVKDEMET